MEIPCVLDMLEAEIVIDKMRIVESLSHSSKGVLSTQSTRPGRH